VRLGKLLRGSADGSAEPSRRRRRAVRPDGPRTIIPLDDAATPSWLPAPARAPMALDLDAARARLRREIPPVADDEE
jgi:hypothetical protein